MFKSRTTKVYKDVSGDWRLTQKSRNGNTTHASAEGYRNKKDLIENEINSAIAVLHHFADQLTFEQLKDIRIVQNKVTDAITNLTQKDEDVE